MIPKRELDAQIRRLRKKHPGKSYAELLKINRREYLATRALPTETKAINTALHNAGLGMSRGLYMETPTGVVNGKAQFKWGKKLSYRGGTSGRSPLIIAMEDFQRDPEHFLRQFRSVKTNLLGEYNRLCKACHAAFVSTRSDAQCCSARCRKRLSRMPNVTLIPR